MAKTDRETQVKELVAQATRAGGITPAEALAALKGDRAVLRAAAHAVTASCTPRRFDFCGIVNARSGRCSENCRWCAQSAHWKTGCENHGWIGTEAVVAAAQAAEANGVSRFALVTSGRAQTPEQVDEICAALREMGRRTRVHLCASLGLVGEADLRKLKEAGLSRYHCNLETAPSHFGDLCTTHTPEEKLATLKAARAAGLEVCCGGILGMGETDEQLVEFAFVLKEVAPQSIPVNILHPIPGTPLGDRPVLDRDRVLDSVALLRLVNPATPLRFAGGRRDLDDATAREAVHVGMSAGIAGPLLTTPGADYDDDRQLAVEAGYDVAPDWRPPAK